MRHRSSGSTGGFKTEAEIARAAAAMPVPLRRKLSLPTYLKRPKKSNMKVLTLDESLHSTWESSNQDPKTVGWNEIHIREYARTVGDNPSCSSGPPLTIGWEYSPGHRVMTVDGYESSRPPRKSLFEMVLQRSERQAMLQDEWKISHSQIASAVRANIQIKNQRRQTVNNLGKMTRLEEMMESAKRKVMRIVKLQKSTSRQIEEMNLQSQKAETEKRKIWAQMDTLPGSGLTERAPKESHNRISQRSNGVVSQQSVCRREDQGLPSQQPRTTRSTGSEESSSSQQEVVAAKQLNKQDEHQLFGGHDNNNDGSLLSQTTTLKKRKNKRGSNGRTEHTSLSQPQQPSLPKLQRAPPSQMQRALPPQHHQPQYQQQPHYQLQQPPQQQEYHLQQQQHMHQQYNLRPTPIPQQQQQQQHHAQYQQSQHFQQPQHFQQLQSYQQPPQLYQQPLQYQPPPTLQKNQQQQLQSQGNYSTNLDDVDDYVFDEETKEFVPRTKK